jgi:predicted PurR-regulated permease PerM
MSTAQIRANRIRVVLGWSALAALSYCAFLVVRPFLIPLGWAAVLATMFYPVFERLSARWGAAWSAATVTLLATLVVIGPLFLAATIFVREALEAAGTLQSALADGRFAWVQRAFDAVQRRIATADRVDVASMMSDTVRRVAPVIASQSGAVLRNVAGFVFDLVVALFATFFLLRDSRIVMRVLRRMLPMDNALRERLIGQIRQLVSVSVTSSLVVAAVQGVLGGLVLAIVGIDAPVFWGGVMALFCLLPLGAWLTGCRRHCCWPLMDRSAVRCLSVRSGSAW